MNLIKGGKTHYKNCDQTQSEELMITSLCNRNMGRYYDSYHVISVKEGSLLALPCLLRQGYCVSIHIESSSLRDFGPKVGNRSTFI